MSDNEKNAGGKGAVKRMDCYAAPDDESSSHSDGSFADWQSETEVEPAVCLFCAIVDMPRAVLAHCKSAHGLDVQQLLKDRGALAPPRFYSRNQYVEAYFASISGNGDYDGIRLVNFVRRQVAAAVEPAEIISEVSNTASSLWADDALLIPALDGDPLLYCLEPEEGEAGEPEVPADPLLRVVGVGITETK